VTRNDDYTFGVLHSKLHILWSLRQGTFLENRPRYTPTTCFETFPLPWPPGKEPAGDPRVHAIANAAHALDAARRAYLDPPDATPEELKKRTLTNLYNARPAWLAMLHADLDRAVWSAYVRPGPTRGIAAAGGESKEGTLSGHPADLAAKADGDHSMPGTREAPEDV